MSKKIKVSAAFMQRLEAAQASSSPFTSALQEGDVVPAIKYNEKSIRALSDSILKALTRAGGGKIYEQYICSVPADKAPSTKWTDAKTGKARKANFPVMKPNPGAESFEFVVDATLQDVASASVG